MHLQTCYAWKKKFDGMRGDVVQRLRQLEQAKERLKRVLADAAGQPDLNAKDGSASAEAESSRLGQRDRPKRSESRTCGLAVVSRTAMA